MTSFLVGTIIAPNYEAYARVLARSLQRFHPGSRLVVLVLNEHPYVIDAAGTEVATPADLPIAPLQFHQMAAMYSVMELATAMKPWLLRYLLSRGIDSAIYLDPDIELFAPVEDIAQLAQQRSLVLTPHVTRPIPRDGLLPGEEEILVAGTYNLGFVAVGAQALPFLDWWQERLYTDCIVDTARGLFVDQRWMDLAVHFFPYYVFRESGFDVAYWNLHEHAFSQGQSGFSVDHQTLRAFHYSGYEPDKPGVLSKHTQSRPRVRLSDDAALFALFDAYRKQLIDAGWVHTSGRPYMYSSSASGIPLHPRIRRLYRAALVAGRKPPDPFDRGARMAFVAWLVRDLKWYAGERIERGEAVLWSKMPRVMNALASFRGKVRESVGSRRRQ